MKNSVLLYLLIIRMTLSPNSLFSKQQDQQDLKHQLIPAKPLKEQLSETNKQLIDYIKCVASEKKCTRARRLTIMAFIAVLLYRVGMHEREWKKRMQEAHVMSPKEFKEREAAAAEEEGV